MRVHIVLLSSFCVLSACSVVDASKKRGVAIDVVMACDDYACFLTLPDTEIMKEEKLEKGTTKTTFRSLLPQGSTSRAVMHGLLDVATLGIWEVAGTPIEGNINRDKFFVYDVTFDESKDVLKAEMLGAGG